MPGTGLYKRSIMFANFTNKQQKTPHTENQYEGYANEKFGSDPVPAAVDEIPKKTTRAAEEKKEVSGRALEMHSPIACKSGGRKRICQ